MNIYQIIKENNLYPLDTNVYVQPFSDGSQFFWHKQPSKIQFINDVNHRLKTFFLSIAQNIPLQKNSIYFEHQEYTQDIVKIHNSNFFKRLQTIYLADRTYDRIITMSDTNKTFYLCIIKPNQDILNMFLKIKGKFLFLFEDENFETTSKNIKILKKNNYTCLYNYQNQPTDLLF